MVKKFTRQCRRHGFDPCDGKIPWRKKWQPTPVFLPGKSHGQRNLVSYSPWGCGRVGQDLGTKQQQLLHGHAQQLMNDVKGEKVKVSVAPSCPFLCESMDCSPPGFSVHGILQARILEWVAIPFFRGSSQPKYQTQVSCIAGGFFTVWATREAPRLEWVAISSRQGIFPTQGSNPGLLHCRRILYFLSHQGSPRILEWVAYPFSMGTSRPRDWTRVSCIAGGFSTSWATQEAQGRAFQVEIPVICPSVHCLHAQLCLTLWNPMNYSLPDSFVHGIFQARILEWVAISYFKFV